VNNQPSSHSFNSTNHVTCRFIISIITILIIHRHFTLRLQTQHSLLPSYVPLYLYASCCHGLRLSDLNKETTYLLTYLLTLSQILSTIDCWYLAHRTYLTSSRTVFKWFLLLIRLLLQIPECLDPPTDSGSIYCTGKAADADWRRSYSSNFLGECFICLITATRR